MVSEGSRLKSEKISLCKFNKLIKIILLFHTKLSKKYFFNFLPKKVLTMLSIYNIIAERVKTVL